MESQSIIRSVYPYDGKIYTGSYKEFGYWKTQPDGRLEYFSLTPLMSDFELQSDEFWEIIAYDDAIYFRSFGAVYKYENNKISKVQDIVSTALGVYQDKLVMAPRKDGLVYLENGEIKLLGRNQEIIKDINIIDIEAQGDTLFIGGKESLYVYSNGEYTKFWDDSINSILEKSELNHIISVLNS